jgi:integrase
MKGVIERGGVKGIWWISFLDQNGVRRKEKIGMHEAAAEMLRIRRAEVKSGRYVPKREERVWSFKRLADDAIKKKAIRLAALTISTDTSRLGRLYERIGQIRYDRFTKERIDAVLGELKAAGRKDSTCNRYRSFISSVYTHAIDTGRMATNPCAKVKRFPEKIGRTRFLSDEEEKRLKRELTDEQEAEVLLAMHTGMRRGEQWGLKWCDVNLDSDPGLAHVTGKTGPRDVRINKEAMLALLRLKEISGDQERVIPAANKEKAAQRDWRTWFGTACKRAGVRGFVWHDLRHTFASRLVMNGADLVAVKDFMGHSDIKMTMRYAHLSKDHKARMIEKTAAPKARGKRI